MLNNYEKSQNGMLEPASIVRSSSGTQQGKSLIRLAGVIKTYHSATGGIPALNRIDLDIYPGEFVAITGKSGAGKTTLINVVAGVDQITSGEVWVDEMPLHQMSENQLAQWRGRKLGVIYQSFHLMPSLSLLDNVLLPIDLSGVYRPKDSTRRALELLNQVELDEHAYKLPSEISGGQQQRVAIARALANDPQIIVADEPTGRLDSVTAEAIFQIFLSLVEDGKTILMVTHDRGLAQRASRTLEIIDGEIAAGEHSPPKWLN